MASTVLYVCLVLTAFACVANCAPHVISMEIATTDVKPVNMTLYFETLCPGCDEFVTTQVPSTWEKVKGLNLMTVNLIPFGNAKESKKGSKWQFDCQHGVEECNGNIAETCILHYHTDTTDRVNMINCFQTDFFASSGSDWKSSLQKCAHTGYNVTAIETCVEGPEGNDLEHTMAMNTAKHEWTPWILIDGVQNNEAQDDLLKAVCKAYKGTTPHVCTKALADE